jgi:hypothetical protein
MRIAGAWVGWGLGDSDPEVQRIKAFMRKKFSYARVLADTPLYDQQMVSVVSEMQARYNAGYGQLAKGKYSPGIINYETKIVMGYVPRPPKLDQRIMLFSVCGTGVPWWIGPDADAARAVESQYRWQPIGYSARAVPMGGSIDEAKAEIINQFNIHRDQVIRCGAALLGYSQGAIVISETWEEEIKPVTGQLHWAMPHITKACAWGNPCREKGKVWPDAGGKPSPKDHKGVTSNLMVDTPDWWRNYAHAGDLYSDCPDDESTEDRTAIWQIIRNGDFMSGPDSLLSQVLELTGIKRDANQISEATGMFKAMLDALVFFGKQTGPHVNYSVAEAIAYLKS